EAYNNMEATYGAYEANSVHRMNEEIAGVAVPTFMCASDPAGPARGGGGSSHGFHANCAVCAGGGTPTTAVLAEITQEINLPVIREDAGGMFGLHSRREFRDCVDGTSNTLMLSEGIIRGRTGG